MSFTNTILGKKTASGSNIQKDVIYQNIPEKYDEYKWVRPADWLTMPDVISSEQKIVGLLAIHDDESNFCALSISGNYTVDWGDGITENYSSGVQANHTYNYSDISNSTITSLGYKQVIVTITPQAGQNITGFSFNVRPSQLLTGTGGVFINVPWLELILSVPNYTSFTNGSFGSRAFTPGASIGNSSLKRIKFVSHGLTNLTSRFTGLPQIEVIEIDTSKVTTLGGAIGRNALIFLPAWDTANVTDSISFDNVNNPALHGGRCIYIPKYNLPKVASINFSDTFYLDTIEGFENTSNVSSILFTNSNVREIPLFNTSNVKSMTSVFQNCNRLKNIPAFDTENANSFVSMFNGCNVLKYIPLFNTSRSSNCTSMFQGCLSLKKIPHLNTSNVTNMTSMFNGATGIKEVPSFVTSKVTNMNSMFNGCTSLVKVPYYDTSNVTNFSGMFLNCSSLQDIPNYNFSSKVTNYSSLFSGAVSLSNLSCTFDMTATLYFDNMFTGTGIRYSPVFTGTPLTNSTGGWAVYSGTYNLKNIPKNFNFPVPNGTQEKFYGTRAEYIYNIKFLSYNMFYNASHLRKLEFKDFSQGAISLNGVANFTGLRSLANITFSNVRFANNMGSDLLLNLTGTKLSQKNLEVMFDSFAGNNASTSAVTLTITNLIGARPEITQLGNLISGRYVIDMANTQLLSVGMEIRGNGITSPVAVTLQTAANTVTLASHGLPENTLISFANTNVAGIDLNTPYRISNVLTNTFQLQNPTSNANITFNADGVGNIFYGATITGINASSNVSITVPLRVTGNNVPTLSGNLKRSIARLKGFTIVG